MGKLVIEGASDDLMEFAGDFSDEGNPSSDEPNFIHLNEGTIVRCEYDENGLWRLKVIKCGERTSVKSHEPGNVEEDTNDVLTLVSAGKFKSFDIWQNEAGPSKRELIEKIECLYCPSDLGGFKQEQLKTIYDILRG